MVFPVTLETERLHLRRLLTSDLDAVFTWASDPECAKYMSFPLAKDAKRDTLPFLESIQPLMDADKMFQWLIEHEGNPIGVVGAVRERGVMLGYILRKSAWGKGFMPEAARAVIDWLVANEPPQRIWASCDVPNTKSAAVMIKIGMTEEGTLRKWGPSPNISAEPVDQRMFSLP